MGERIFERVSVAGSVFRDKGVLSSSFRPGVVVGRGVEVDFFARILVMGVEENYFPPVIQVFGMPGSGKTVVVRDVLERFSGLQGGVFRHVFVNLKGCRTVFSAGNEEVLMRLCGRRVPAVHGLSKVYSEIWGGLRCLSGGMDRLFLCLVLDEVDSIFFDKHYDVSDFFYNFIRYQEFLEDDRVILFLVVITNSPRVLEDNLDARVKSSMGNVRVMFPAYSKGELADILYSRLSDGFRQGAVVDGVVEYCAELVSSRSGDARRAIDLLRVSGEVANERGCRVGLGCVEEARSRVEQEWVDELLGDLPLNSALIIACIALLSTWKTTFSMRVLCEKYRKTKIGGKHERLSDRRVLGIVDELSVMGIIKTWNVSRGRYGYKKEIRIAIDPQLVLNYLSNRPGKAIRVKPVKKVSLW